MAYGAHIWLIPVTVAKIPLSWDTKKAWRRSLRPLGLRLQRSHCEDLFHAFVTGHAVIVLSISIPIEAARSEQGRTAGGRDLNCECSLLYIVCLFVFGVCFFAVLNGKGKNITSIDFA